MKCRLGLAGGAVGVAGRRRGLLGVRVAAHKFVGRSLLQRRGAGREGEFVRFFRRKRFSCRGRACDDGCAVGILGRRLLCSVYDDGPQGGASCGKAHAGGIEGVLVGSAAVVCRRRHSRGRYARLGRVAAHVGSRFIVRSGLLEQTHLQARDNEGQSRICRGKETVPWNWRTLRYATTVLFRRAVCGSCPTATETSFFSESSALSFVSGCAAGERSLHGWTSDLRVISPRPANPCKPGPRVAQHRAQGSPP